MVSYMNNNVPLKLIFPGVDATYYLHKAVMLYVVCSILVYALLFQKKKKKKKLSFVAIGSLKCVC